MALQLLEEAQALQAHTVALRREIHRHPELGLHLPRTQAAVLDSRLIRLVPEETGSGFGGQ